MTMNHNAGRGRPVHKRSHPLNRAAPLVACIAAAGALLAACSSSLDSIDRRVDRLVRERSDRINAEPPDTDYEKPPRRTDPEVYEEDVPTTNPAAAELTYTPGPTELSDVLDRLNAFYIAPREQKPLGLRKAWEIAQSSSREFLIAEEDYILQAIELLVERHDWNPRFFDQLSTSLGLTDPEEGDTESALNVMNEFGVRQRLPYGGEVEASIVTQAARQLLPVISEANTSSTELVLSADVPLMRGAGMPFRDSLIQAERSLIYAARDFERFRRSFLVDIATDYFQLVNTLQRVKNQRIQLWNLKALYEQRKALVDAGRVRGFELRNIEQQLLSARIALINVQESYKLALDRFKIRLGLDVTAPYVLDPARFSLADPEASTEEASRAALDYRLDYQNEVDRIEDERRDIAVARNRLLPDLNLSLSASFGTGDSEGLENLDPDGLENTDYSGTLALGLPLDREVERLNLRSAMIDLQRALRRLSLTRDNLILDARQSLRDIKQARFAVQLQQQSVYINERRIVELRLNQDEVDVQQQIDAEEDLLNASNALDQARSDLQSSILDFLLATGQLRVGFDGSLKRLPGMEVTIEPIDEPIEQFDGETLEDQAYSKHGDNIDEVIESLRERAEGEGPDLPEEVMQDENGIEGDEDAENGEGGDGAESGNEEDDGP